MSREKYQEGCKGCKPVLLDLTTNQRLPDDHPAMKAILGVWKTLTLPEKEAWHEFTCHNSRESQIVATISRINQLMQEALKKVYESS